MQANERARPLVASQKVYSSSKQGDFALRSKNPGQSQVALAFPRLSLSDLRDLVFAKQAAAVGVAESNTGVCNMYDKREWYQHQRVRGGRACLTSYALSPSGPLSNAADDRSRQRGAARAADE